MFGSIEIDSDYSTFPPLEVCLRKTPKPHHFFVFDSELCHSSHLIQNPQLKGEFMLKEFLFGGTTGSTTLGNIGEAALRIFAGLAMAFGHGMGKVPPQEGFIGAVTGLGFPQPQIFAWAAGLSEFVGGILLAIGLATRFSALTIMGTMAVAAFMVHANDPFKGKEMALLYLAISFFFVLRGSGDISVDALVRGKKR
jgi:putative oxidoreductase